MTEAPPSKGFSGILHHWKDDLSAAISVTLVALPLALGIAMASGVPPMSGVLAAIIGGIVTTFFRGSHVAINGPAAGLIVVILAGVESLADENGSGFPYVLAAIVIAGLIQVVLGLLKMGKLGDLFPVSVVNGMLATIGVIIFVKQIHVALGVSSDASSSMETLLEIPKSILTLNPTVTLVSILSLSILIFHPYLKNNFLRSIPAPLQVLIVAVPLVAIIDNMPGLKDISIMNYPVYFGSDNLVKVPQNLLDNIIFPDFSKIGLLAFWQLVISITLVASIETLISAKAVDKLDHYKRRTDLNKDLFAVGLSTAISGFLGGLPIITVIVRSSVNVNHKAKTKWSNLYHGILLLVFVFLFPFIIREIPIACLATILVYTGYKLASPKVFKSALLKGWEQLLILIATLFASLAIDLLWGIIFGIFTTLLIHWLKSQLHIKTFIRHLIYTEIKTVQESKNVVHVEIKGIANFCIMLKLINLLSALGNGKHFIVDFRKTKLVDSTILDFIHEHREKYFTETDFEFTGLDVHVTSSPHPLALHILKKPMQKRLTDRQNEIYHFATNNKYIFKPEIDWMVNHFERFSFFEYHLMEYQGNRLEGTFEGNNAWIISDVTYNDGILMASEEHHITVMILTLHEKNYDFRITKDDIRHLKNWLKNSNGEEVLPEHLNAFVLFLDDNASFDFERIGDKIMIHRKTRLLSAKEIITLHDFAKKMHELLPIDQNDYFLLSNYFR